MLERYSKVVEVRKRFRSRSKINFFSLCFCVSVVIILFTAPFVSTQSRSGLGWTWQNPLPQGNPLYSIHFAKDKETGIAIGADSTILRTTDGGFHWQKQFSPVDATFSSAYIVDEELAFIVGSRGMIL